MNIDIVKAEEPWVVLHLADGSILKARVNIAAVDRIDGQYDQAGNPIYNVQQTIQVALIPHESLKRPAGAPAQTDNAARAAAELLMRGDKARGNG